MSAGRATILALVLAAVAYEATSYALESSRAPHPPPGFATLAATPPSPAEAVAINNLLGGLPDAEYYGVTTASIARARRLASTHAGNLYLIPGNTGACLAFTSGVVCGNPEKDRMLVLLGADPATGNAVGGGVVSEEVKSVTITTSASSARTLPVSNGAFRITPKDAIAAANAPLHLSANIKPAN
jgi:hypothetical protein